MSELNLQPEHNAAIDTNAEYILPEVSQKQPPVFKSVAKAIIIETVKDFFRSIIGFFLRYIKHFVRCVVYFFVPSIQKKPFNKLDYKQNSQHAFEFVVIILALVIFMEKLEWIPQTSAEMMEFYSNDLMQKFMEVYFFILFAALYLLSAAISIFSGRLFRMIFKLNVSRDESDILFNYLNNAFFSIAAVIAFALRCMAAIATHDEESIMIVVVSIFLPTAAIGMLIWSFRFAQLHQVKIGKGLLFGLVTLLFYTMLYFFTSLVIASLFLAI
jgi:hypothetical protein